MHSTRRQASVPARQRLKSRPSRCQERATKILKRWRAEVDALPAKKKSKWKGRLYDQCKVCQQVRYIGEANKIMGVPYSFVVYKPLNHVGGGGWWPVLDAEHAQKKDIQQEPLSENGGQMESSDMWATFKEIQAETHTGKRKRNHYVQVPVAASEPVRG